MFSVSWSIGQHNAMEIFAVKLNIVSETSKVSLNNIFAELDGSSGIKNIINYTVRLNIDGLQVDDIAISKVTAESRKNYNKEVNQALSICFFESFQ